MLCRTLSTGFIAENQSLTNWPLCGNVSQLVAQHLHVLANLFQLKFFTVCEQDVCAAELCVEPLIFVQKFCVGTLADYDRTDATQPIILVMGEACGLPM